MFCSACVQAGRFAKIKIMKLRTLCLLPRRGEKGETVRVRVRRPSRGFSPYAPCHVGAVPHEYTDTERLKVKVNILKHFRQLIPPRHAYVSTLRPDWLAGGKEKNNLKRFRTIQAPFFSLHRKLARHRVGYPIPLPARTRDSYEAISGSLISGV